MKKTLAAIAVLGAFSGAALAQSNVQIYGIVDGGVRLIDPTIGGLDSTFGVASGQQSGSRFGLRGAEDLTQGLKAVFQLEGGFDIDTGQSGQGGRLFGREARIGLDSSGWGGLNFGRFGAIGSGTGSQDLLDGVMSAFGTSYEDAGMQGSVIGTNDRYDNMVSYQTPTMAGFKAGAMYSFQTNGNEVPGTDQNTRYFGVGFNYKMGNLSAGLTYEQQMLAFDSGATPPVPEKDDTKMLKVGGAYDFGFIKPYAYYVRGEGGSLEGVSLYNGSSAVKSDAFGISASVPLFGGSLLAGYQWFKSDDFRVAGATTDSTYEREIYALGYEYPFSKRTNFYSVASFSMGSKTWDKDNYASATTDAMKAAFQAINRNVYEIGLRHKF